MRPLEEYFAAVVRDAVAAVGSPVLAGTVLAAAADRAGTGSATSSPTPTATVVWCDPALAERLAPLASSIPMRSPSHSGSRRRTRSGRFASIVDVDQASLNLRASQLVSDTRWDAVVLELI